MAAKFVKVPELLRKSRFSKRRGYAALTRGIAHLNLPGGLLDAIC